MHLQTAISQLSATNVQYIVRRIEILGEPSFSTRLFHFSPPPTIRSSIYPQQLRRRQNSGIARPLALIAKGLVPYHPSFLPFNPAAEVSIVDCDNPSSEIVYPTMMHIAIFSAALYVVIVVPSTSGFAPVPHRGGAAARASHVPPPLQMGIMDEVRSGAFDLSSLLSGGDGPDDELSTSEMEKAYEMFLGQLVFSSNDPRIDIMDNYDLCADPKWLSWLERKISGTRDVEERSALRDLLDMIVDVKKRTELSRAAEERAAREAEEGERDRIASVEADMERGRSLSGADVLRRAAAVDSAGVNAALVRENDRTASAKKSFYEKDLTPEVRSSYADMCSRVLPPYRAGDTPSSVVYNNYDQFDAQFIKVLNERAANGDADSQAVLDALAIEQQRRVADATDKLKEVLSKGDPMRMEGAIVKLAREGRIDEPFLLLLEANADQARAAGATGPAELMMKLRRRAMAEKDKQSATKEIKLLRQLLREPDSNKREQLLTDAFTPKESLIVSVLSALITRNSKYWNRIFR